jgi:hypothetical protein
MVKPLSALLAMALLGVGVTACANTTKCPHLYASPSHIARTRGARMVVSGPVPRQRPGINDSYDGDDHNPNNTSENNDDPERHGRPATLAERQSVTEFVEKYYTAAVANNGAVACSLLIPSLVNGIGGSYERPGDPSYLHGKTCAQVMTKLFEHEHKLIAAEAAGLEVTGVRVGSGMAFGLLAFKGAREPRYLGVERYDNTWKLRGLTESPYP